MQFIMAIRDELEENELLRDAYGDLVGNKTWANIKINTSTKIQVVGKGAGQKLRGIKYKYFRPDIIIVDDIADSGRTLIHYRQNDTQFNNNPGNSMNMSNNFGNNNNQIK